ncbi:MAG TPA: HNH endonuclease [Lachnospiraceae bacterium]|nr:HNH endonuclease [Lachnospiraceae bacterium]
MAKEWAAAFYRSSAWKAARKKALIRDGFTCRICGARATAVDHIRELTPENINNRMISLDLSNLQSLCHDCHTIKTMEDKGKIKPDCDAGYYFDADGQLTPRGG